jgi:hypothetical protein
MRLKEASNRAQNRHCGQKQNHVGGLTRTAPGSVPQFGQLWVVLPGFHCVVGLPGLLLAFVRRFGRGLLPLSCLILGKKFHRRVVPNLSRIVKSMSRARFPTIAITVIPAVYPLPQRLQTSNPHTLVKMNDVIQQHSRMQHGGLQPPSGCGDVRRGRGITNGHNAGARGKLRSPISVQRSLQPSSCHARSRDATARVVCLVPRKTDSVPNQIVL